MNSIIKNLEQIVNKTFLKMLDEFGYDVELTIKPSFEKGEGKAD